MKRQGDRSELTMPVAARDHRRGSDNAAVTLVEYGDFQCPRCAQFFPLAEQLLATLAGQLRFVYRHFPLTPVHPQAERAAEAAEAAAGQGRFWDMHRALFEQQGRLADDEIIECAAGIGLDVPQFLRDLTQHRFRPRVQEDWQSGMSSGVQGTPTLFINDKQYRGPLDLPFLLEAARAAAINVKE